MTGNDTAQLNRRNFIGWITGAIGALIGAAYTVPAIAYILGDSLRTDVKNWILLGPTHKVEPGTPTLYKAQVTRTSGWVSTNDDLSVYVLTENGREYIALSNICTHLGCRVRWIAAQNQFYCPCHVGIFDKEGNVISGPAPRPLDRLPIMVEKDQLFILAG
ncbi:MAG: Rieske 2Fe-2S domain-containing protein [Gammaproteobacteria bacterium]|nr:Rieske 2Fe-2S domain-containing protein [Gammaproteobacteria bacterium]